MKVEMKKAHRAALDGVHVRDLAVGEVVDAPDDQAARWIERGIAVEFERKASGAAPENKAGGPSPKTKTKAPRAPARGRRRTRKES